MSARGLGIVGWGAAGRLMAEAVSRTSRFHLAGVADADPATRERAAQETGRPAYANAEALAAAEDVEIVYVATPTASHVSDIRAAAEHGRHVISEKPLAATFEDARRAVESTERAGVSLLVGATHSYNAPVEILRGVVESGRLGELVSVSSVCHTDWRLRSRSVVDLDASLGNGVVLRQGAHQIDVLRYVCGGLAETVTGTTFGGSGGRELGFTAQLAFAGGAQASAYYSGAGGFDSRLLTGGVGELGTLDVVPTPELARFFPPPSSGPVSPVFGTLVATFTAGGAWVAPSGVLLVTPERVFEEAVGGRLSGWDAVLCEADAVLAGRPAVHSGRWGLATLEASLAVHESDRAGRRVELVHQVGVGRPSQQS
ncbi:Gfo/Idh/MocA family oxidoreductase [Amycolatopsis sp. NPDC049253]|uniref:Gfo/Idh/MocA family protein n=1 Tax=Amycolatopsis sp. NPDC049253 TaxID=3155274 RepID=UPI003441C624